MSLVAPRAVMLGARDAPRGRVPGRALRLSPRSPELNELARALRARPAERPTTGGARDWSEHPPADALHRAPVRAFHLGEELSAPLSPLSR